MTYDFPKIQLSEADRIWMEAIYSKLRSGAEVGIRALKIELWGKVPNDFDPYKIDPRLVLAGYQITLLGIWHIDPLSDLIAKTDKIIYCIRDMILKDHKVQTFHSDSVAALTRITKDEVAMIFESVLPRIGNFQESATTYTVDGKRLGYETIGYVTDYMFNEYLSYSGIEELMKKLYMKRAPHSSARITNPSPDQRSQYYPNTAFIMMWMDESNPELEDICNAVKEVCISFGIKAVRADDIEHQDKITDVVLTQIAESEHLIADLSGERPNVYYEVGYAHAHNKHPILFRRQGTRLHFDLSIHNVPEYKNITDLKALLRKRFEAILGRCAANDI